MPNGSPESTFSPIISNTNLKMQKHISVYTSTYPIKMERSTEHIVTHLDESY